MSFRKPFAHTWTNPFAVNATGDFTPASIGSALSFWLDSSDPSTYTVNGSNVITAISDKSIYKHAITVGNNPTVIANQVNGRPIIRFTKAEADSLSVADSTTLDPESSVFNVFVVAKIGSIITGNYGLINKANTASVSEGWSLWWSTTTFYFRARGEGVTNRVELTKTIGANLYKFRAEFDGDDLVPYINDDSTGFTSGLEGNPYAPPLETSSDMTIGNLSGNFGSFDLCEIIITKGATADKITAINTYLDKKWNLA